MPFMMQATARKAREVPAAWLSMKDIYGELAVSERFASAFAAALAALWRDGTRETPQRHLDGG